MEKMKARRDRRMKEEDPALHFGHIPGIRVGKWWATRKDCSADRVHPPFIAGIYGRQDDGARSIVLSGTSEFADEDHGEYFEYVGSGGRAPGNRFGPQTEDQNFKNSRNKALQRSAFSKRPVRVIRGAGDSKYAPYHGYRYDGLYLVENPRLEVGPTGFKICKFDFKRLKDQDPLPTDRGPRDVSDIAARRRQYLRTVPRQKASSSSKKRKVAGPSRGASSSGEDDDDVDNLESLFTAPEEVEEALEPVLPQLAQFSRRTTSSAEKKARRPLLVEIGDHIRAVLEQKRESGEDYEWWRHELWSFVVGATPKKDHHYTVKQYEDLYEKFKMQQVPVQVRRDPEEGKREEVDVNVKREMEEEAEYMLVDVKPKLEPES